MIICFDLLKYVGDLDQLALGMTSTVVRTIDQASEQLMNTERNEKAEAELQKNQIG